MAIKELPGTDKMRDHAARLADGDHSWGNLEKVAQSFNGTRSDEAVQAILATLPETGSIRGVLHFTRRTIAHLLGMDPKDFEASRPKAVAKYLK